MLLELDIFILLQICGHLDVESLGHAVSIASEWLPVVTGERQLEAML